MKKVKILSVFLVLCFVFSTSNARSAEQAEPYFYISLLSPNTNPARNQWSILIESQLPKIGVGITHHESTGWGSIYPRTWEYPVGVDFDYIPTYEDGGYDILFVGWSWGLDWDPTGLYDTASIVPAGDNMYQYSNADYDAVLLQYTSELDAASRIPLVKLIQQILYDDLPSITLIYPKSLFGINEYVTGYDELLIATSSQRAEFWVEPDDDVITYALPAELTEYNVYVQASYYDALWMMSVYGSLYARKQTTRLYAPMIAASKPVASDDDLQFNITIDSDAKFSNGHPVLAEDVKYTYELHMTPSVASASYGYLTQFLENNDSIVVLDDATIQFNLKQPYFLATSLFSFQLIEKSTVEPYFVAQGPAIFNLEPVVTPGGTALVTSCGAFILADYDTVTSTAVLEPNPYWHGTTPSLDQLIFTFISGKDSAISALAAGTVEIVDSQYSPVLDDYIGVEGVDAVLVADPSTQEMAINLRHPILGTGELTPVGTAAAALAIRKAISHTVPRNVLVNEILEGLAAPASNPMPDASVGFDDTLEPYAYDIDLAREYMAEAGYGITTSPTTTTSPTSTTSPTTKEKSTISVGSYKILLLNFLAIASIFTLRRIRRK